MCPLSAVTESIAAEPSGVGAVFVAWRGQAALAHVKLASASGDEMASQRALTHMLNAFRVATDRYCQKGV